MIDIRKWNESAQSTQPQPNSTSCEQDKNERLCFWQKKNETLPSKGKFVSVRFAELAQNESFTASLGPRRTPASGIGPAKGSGREGARPTRLSGLSIVTRDTTLVMNSLASPEPLAAGPT